MEEHVESRGGSCGSLLHLDLPGESREIQGDLFQALRLTFWDVSPVVQCTSLILINLFLCKHKAWQVLEEELVAPVAAL